MSDKNGKVAAGQGTKGVRTEPWMVVPVPGARDEVPLRQGGEGPSVQKWEMKRL